MNKKTVFFSAITAFTVAMCGCIGLNNEEYRMSDDLAEISVKDTLMPIRPGGNGKPFWNKYAIQFIYAPAFEFAKVDGAAEYLFEAKDRFGKVHSFSAMSPCAALSPVWRDIHAGPVWLEVNGIDKKGKKIAVAGQKTFYRNAPFVNSYPSKVRSYLECAEKNCEYLFNLKYVQSLADGKPDLSYPLFCYPSKMYSAIINIMLDFAELNPAKREKALQIAEGAADYLIEKAVPSGKELEFLPQTYEGKNEAAGKFGGTIMMLYPANVGSAMLNLYKINQKQKYLDYAVKIGEQYLKLQQPNGTWYLVLKIADGNPTVNNYCVPTGIMAYLEKLSAVTGDNKYAAAAQKGMPHLLRMMDTFNWEGQFEDVEAQSVPYLNLTKHNATAAYLYLCSRNPSDKKLAAGAREVQRFAEDQFIVWEQFGWTGKYDPFSPRKEENSLNPVWGWMNQHTPCVLEQYRCYVPVNASYAKLIRFYLLMYDLDKKPLDLAKARALGDSLTRIQLDDGRIPTWMNQALSADTDWINCDVSVINALTLLAKYDSIK